MKAQGFERPEKLYLLQGTTPVPIDGVMPYLINDIYDYDGNKMLDGAAGWRPLTTSELYNYGIDPDILVNEKNGLLSHVYADENGNFALVYAGSNELKDWVPTNLGQGLGFEMAQYSQAIEAAEKCKQAFGDRLILAGQSLGGGLAAAASMVTETPAVTYNAAGVHPNTVERLGLDFSDAKRVAREGLIRNYRVDGDILTFVQEKAPIINWLAPDAVGVQINLPNPEPERPVTLGQSIQLHRIPAVIKAMDIAYPELTPDVVRREREAAQPHLGTVNGKEQARPDMASHPLYQQALAGVHRVDDGRGRTPDHLSERLAAGLAAEAAQSGFSRISHVALSADGARAFAIDTPDANAHDRRLVAVDVAKAMQADPAHTAQRLHDASQQVPQAQTPVAREWLREPPAPHLP